MQARRLLFEKYLGTQGTAPSGSEYLVSLCIGILGILLGARYLLYLGTYR